MHASRKWLAGLLLLTLVVGGIGGVLAERLLFTPVSAATPDRPENVTGAHRGHDRRSRWRGRGRLERYTERLELDAEQQKRLSVVFEGSGGEYRTLFESLKPRMDELRNASRDRVRAILRPEQVPAYETMLQEYDERRARWGKMWGRKGSHDANKSTKSIEPDAPEKE